jgi:hypothetical protein
MERKAIHYGIGAAAGAALMALLDPISGGRRRAILRDKAARSGREISEGAGVVRRDLRNRARGLAAEAVSLTRGEPIPDSVLVERVRAKLGRLVSNPSAIEVEARGGRVTMFGPVFTEEADELLGGVGRVRGVDSVEDRLERHEEAGQIPGLQGGRRARGERFELLQANWSPTARLLAGTAGAGLTTWGVRRRGPLGWIAAVLGVGLAARSVTNRGLERLAQSEPNRSGGRATASQETARERGGPQEPMPAASPEEPAAQGREPSRSPRPAQSRTPRQRPEPTA